MKHQKKIKAEFVLPIPSLTFHHKHLSLDKQRKDKEIKREREQLEKKRKQFEQTKNKWAKEELQFRQYSAKRREQNMSLVLKQQKLKIDLFRLSIRKEQIQSRNNPQITHQKAEAIKSYLRCVSYTAGKRLQSIKFWKSQARYNQLRFLLEFAVDRFFGRSVTQKEIISNLSRIVFCKKLKFESQWVMLCIKQPQFSSSNYCYRTCKKSHRSIYHPQNSSTQKWFQLIIYAITGEYFHINKFYTQQQLKERVQPHSNSHKIIPKQTTNTHRLSVADNLAKINALKQLSQQVLKSPQIFMERTRKESTQSFDDGRFKIISEEAVPSSVNTEHNEQLEEDLTTPHIQNAKKNSNEESESSKDPTSQNLSDANQSEAQSQTAKLKTRKSMISKSSFYIKGKNETYICKINRQFLSGIQELLFPAQNPIRNVVILKQKREVYFLRQYLEIVSKKMILDKAVARFRLKMKIKAQRKKCLYYKIASITSCLQTVMGQEQSISLPCLFVLKGQETSEAHQIYIHCHSIISHPKIQNGLHIKALLHQVAKQKEEQRQNKTGRNSNIKNIKNGTQRRSRQSKRKQNLRNPSKNLAVQQHQKSSFGSAKKKIEPWIAFSPQIVQRYQKFMENHLISIQTKQFLTRQWVKNRIFGIIRIQNKIRSIISKRRLKQSKQVSRFKCKWRPNTKILITAVLNTNNKIIKVFIEKVDNDNSEPVRTAQYSEQNWDAICTSIQDAQNQGDFKDVSNNLFNNIEEKINLQAQIKAQLQRQKPQKYKKMIRDFFFMIKIKNKVKKNIFYVKKVTIKQRTFVLLIRRDKYVKSLLQCNLYDLILQKGNQDQKQTKSSETAFSKQQKQVGSEYGSHKPASRSKPELDDKIYRYQKLYLMQQYFEGIDSKRIIDQFYIEKGVFLLKPPRSSDVYYIQRLNTLDLNSEEFAKQFLVYEKEQCSLKINEDRLSLNVSNKSLKRLIDQNISDKTQKNDKSQTQSRQLLNLSKLRAKKQSKQNAKKDKKTSIQKNERELMTFLKSNFMRQNLHNMQMVSKKSLGQSNSGKAGRQIYQVKNNSHESIVYYSLYKCSGVFFNLEFFIVQKTLHDNAYHETLVSLQKYRIYKKQLQQSSSSLFYKKLAAWAHENEDRFVRSHDNSKEKSEQLYKKEESFTNLVTLQFFNALISGNKRFSFEIQNNITSEKGPRTNTLIL